MSFTFLDAFSNPPFELPPCATDPRKRQAQSCRSRTPSKSGAFGAEPALRCVPARASRALSGEPACGGFGTLDRPPLTFGVELSGTQRCSGFGALAALSDRTLAGAGDVV